MPEEVAILAFTSIVVGGVIISMVIRSVTRYHERKLEREARGGGVALEEVRSELAELRGSLASLQGEMTEIQERLDFTERLLAQQRDASRPRLGEGVE